MGKSRNDFRRGDDDDYDRGERFEDRRNARKSKSHAHEDAFKVQDDESIVEDTRYRNARSPRY